MSRRRTRNRGPARCQTCQQPIKWLRFRGRWRPFAPTAIVPSDAGAAAFPVEAGQAWLVSELIEELQGRRACSSQEAEDEVYDMPWHQVHVCPTTPDEEEADR